MPAAVSRYRASLLAVSAALFPLIFAFFLILEKPGLGIGHFYYFPVAMIALASGPLWGAAAGSAATGFYALGILINPHLPPSEVLTVSSSIDSCRGNWRTLPLPMRNRRPDRSSSKRTGRFCKIASERASRRLEASSAAVPRNPRPELQGGL